MLLSLDVGFKNTGWTVFDNGSPVKCGCIITEKSKKKGVRTADENAYRAAQLARKLKDIVNTYQSRPL